MIKKIAIAIILFILISFLPNGYVSAAEGKIFTDATGEAVVISDYPKRIVSLAPSITENLFFVGAGENIVGVTSYCNFPAQAKDKEKIGGMVNPNIEKIISLKPDLVIGTKEGNEKDSILSLRRLGVPVYVLKEINSFQDIYHTISTLGNLTGKEQEADKVVGNMQEEAQNIENKIKTLNKPKPTVFWEIGINPLITVGKGTFTDDLIKFAGGQNLVTTSIRYPRYSLEEVINKNPEVIVLVGMGIASEIEAKNWQRFSEVSAVKNERVYIINPDLVTRPSAQIILGLKELASFLHPEIFINK